MHITEGVLSVTPEGTAVLAGAWAATAAGTALGLWRMDYERVPQVALFSAAFFVVSLVEVPMPPSSVHLVLSGLAGLVLGWAAFPALLVALLLQAVFFGLGGPTTLGINTLTMALPAVVCYHAFGRGVHSRSEPVTFAWGFAAGMTAILLGAVMTSGALMAAGEDFVPLANALFVVHLPVAVVEGLVTGSVVVFLRKVRPELLRAPLLVPRP